MGTSVRKTSSFDCFPMASTCSLPTGTPSKLLRRFATLALTRAYFTDLVGDEQWGEVILASVVTAITKHMKWREANPSVKVLDLSFKNVTKDSVGTAEKVFDFIGKPMTDSARQGIEAWDKSNPQHKHGKPSYSVDTYGLTVEQIDDAFAEYQDYFSEYL